jgi:uncharacterized phage protein gp47/JayE
MPWLTPTLREVREIIRDDVTSALTGAIVVGNSVLRVMSDATAGLTHLTLRYIDWLARQFLPDTAEIEWLDRHGDIWLVNSDNTIGRKSATFASGTVLFTGSSGSVVQSGTILDSGNGIQYQTTEEVVLGDDGADAPIVAMTAGVIGNLPDGTAFNPAGAILGVDSVAASGNIDGGTDTETDDELRARILRRIQQPPQGGAAYDYEAWALAVPGVTRAWCYPLEMGIGTVTVRFMMDELRANNGGFPIEEDIETVTAYLDSVRPVAVKDIFVEAPIPQPIDFNIANLKQDTPAVRGEIMASIEDMLLIYAEPGQTFFTAWKYQAVLSASGVVSFDFTTTADDVMQSHGHMAVLGDIFYTTTPLPQIGPPSP